MCDSTGRSLASLFTVCLGSSVSLIALFNNSLLFYCLIRSPRCFKCYFQFLLVLSFCDIIISLCYIPVILVDSLKDWLNSLILARIFWSYFVYLLTVTHIVMTTASFVLVGVLVERYLITIRSSLLKSVQSHRTSICIASIIIAVVSKGGIIFELDVFPSTNAECKNTVQELYVDTTSLCGSILYGTVYKFWFRNIVTVFLPFFLLIFINFKTLLALKTQFHQARIRGLRKFSVRVENKTKVRSATWTLLLVCFLYLLSNLMNVVVTAWEFIDMNSLQDQFLEFYMFSTDLVSLLVVIACAMRLPIYMLCNPELRKVINSTLDQKDGKEKLFKSLR